MKNMALFKGQILNNYREKKSSINSQKMNIHP
jgi:hypothetical protein